MIEEKGSNDQIDINLPGMNGSEVNKAIKELNENMPVIAQTAYAMADEKIKCLEAGCNDYVTKPVNQSILFEKMHRFLQSPIKSSFIHISN